MADELLMTSEFLSYQLEMYPDTLQDVSEAETGEAGEPKSRRRVLGKAIREAVSSLEGFTEEHGKAIADVLQRDPGGWEYFVDDFYSHEVVANIPGMVSRFVRLSPVLVGVIPSREVSAYLREATRCFIYGFFQATIAVCRAALDAGLNDRLEDAILALPELTLCEKIKRAGQGEDPLLTPETASLAHDVRKTANDVLHGEPTLQQDATFGVLVQTRAVLKELYEE